MMSGEAQTHDRGAACDGAKTERPLTWTELCDRAEIVEATKEVPENLRSLWSDLSVSREAAVVTIRERRGGQTHVPDTRSQCSRIVRCSGGTVHLFGKSAASCVFGKFVTP
jgi:hypothetical protein